MQFEQMIARKQKFSTRFCFHLLPLRNSCKAGKGHVHIVEKELSHYFGTGAQVYRTHGRAGWGGRLGGLLTQVTFGTRTLDYKHEGFR